MGLQGPHRQRLPDRPVCPRESSGPLPLPSPPRGNRHFLFPVLQYNGTYDGVYTVHTGRDDISKVGLIDSWRGNK